MNEYIIIFSYMDKIEAKSFYDYEEALNQFKIFLGKVFICGRNFVTVNDNMISLATILNKDIKKVFDNLGTDAHFVQNIPSVIVKINKI